MSAGAPSLINSPPLLLVKVERGGLPLPSGTRATYPTQLLPPPPPPPASLPLRANSLYSRRREGGNAFSSAAGAERRGRGARCARELVQTGLGGGGWKRAEGETLAVGGRRGCERRAMASCARRERERETKNE